MPRPLALDRQQVRTIRIASQGLAAVPGAPVAALLTRSGWVRTLGGCDAYLALRARNRNLRRVEVDAAIGRGDLQVVPAARGCIYLVPRADAPLCLRLAESMSRARTLREHSKAGIRSGEVEALAVQVHAALRQHGPLTTDALRKLLPPDAVRSLGDAGKKVGISSPLPAALRQLEFAGHIARTPEANHLDNERYCWRPLADNAFAGSNVPDDPAALHRALLQRFVEFAGVATARDFAAWSGLSQRDARAAAAGADLLTVDCDGEEALSTESAQNHLRMRSAIEAAVAFLPFEDNLLHLHGGPGHLVDAAHAALTVPSWGRGRPTTLATATHLSLRGLIADGQLSGFWEFDPDARLAVPRCFRTPSKVAADQIEAMSASTTVFLRDEIGHGRSFSLDTDDELRARLAQLASLRNGSGAPAKARTAAKPRATPAARTKARTKNGPRTGGARSPKQTATERPARKQAAKAKVVRLPPAPRRARPTARGKKP